MTGLVAIACLCGCAPASDADAPVLEVVAAEARTGTDGQDVAARVRYQFSDAVLRAMRNGVAITLSLETRVVRPRRHLWAKVLLKEQRLYRLDYHALSDQYMLEDLSTGRQTTYRSYLAMQESLGGGAGLRAVEGARLPEGPLEARIRASLHIASLPAPLRLSAWFSPEWHLQSEWFVWPLRG